MVLDHLLFPMLVFKDASVSCQLHRELLVFLSEGLELSYSRVYLVTVVVSSHLCLQEVIRVHTFQPASFLPNKVPLQIKSISGQSVEQIWSLSCQISVYHQLGTLLVS